MQRSLVAMALSILILSGVTGLSGCGSDYHLVDARTWNGELVMELWITDDTLEAGDELGIRASVENITDEEMEYTVWNIGDPAIYIQVVPPHGERMTVSSGTGPGVVLPAVEIGELGATDRIRRTVKWRTSKTEVNGTYEIQARFYPGDQAGLPAAEPIVLTWQIELTDGMDIVDQEELESKVEDLTSVSLWMSAHTGTAVARAGKEGYSVNRGGEWEEANEQAYEAALDAGQHPTWQLSEDMPKQWIVRYHSKFGFEPTELVVTIDALKGEIESVSPDMAAQLDGGIVATFKVQKSEFRVFVTNSQTINSLFELEKGESSANIPNGPLLPGPGAGLHNTPWSWHLDPEKITMADFTIELCDGTPEFVEEELEYWLDSVGQYCPWGARLVNIKDYR